MAAAHGMLVMRLDVLGVRESWTVEPKSLELTDYTPTEADQALKDSTTTICGAVDWLQRQTGRPELVLAGSCYGAFQAVLGARRFRETVAVGMVAPWVEKVDSRPLPGRPRLFGRREVSPGALDSNVVRALRRLLPRVAVRAIVGEHDDDGVYRLQAALGPRGQYLDIETVPGLALHPFRAPAAQTMSIERLVAWVGELVGREAHPESVPRG
jgi:dienelactone hydrolase